MFNTHPNFRNRETIQSLIVSIKNRIAETNGKTIKTNVYKENIAAINFHKKLGFKKTNENEKGYEFTLLLE